MNKRLLTSGIVCTLAGAVWAAKPGYFILGTGGSDYNTLTYNKMNFDGSNSVAITPGTFGGGNGNSYGMVGGASYEVMNAALNQGEILYATNLSGSDYNTAGDWRLWTMGRAGSNRKQITFDHSYSADGYSEPSTFQDNLGAAISPDGTKVAYLENCPYWTGTYYALQTNLFVVTLNAPGTTQMFTNDNPGIPAAASTYSALAWAPDSNQIVVTGQDFYDATYNPSGDSHYIGEAIINLSGGTNTVIHQHYNNVSGPATSVAWSLDGNTIAFLDEAGIQYMDPSGGVSAAFPSITYQTSSGFQFDNTNHLWVMYYGSGLYQYDLSGNLTNTFDPTGLNTDWGFCIADGPAVAAAASITASKTTETLGVSAGSGGAISFVVKGVDGSNLSSVITGFNGIQGTWGGTFLNAALDGYGNFTAAYSNPGYTQIEVTNGSATSAPINVYTGYAKVYYKAGSGAQIQGEQSWWLKRWNTGNALEGSENVTLTIGGVTPTTQGSLESLAAGQTQNFQVYVPLGTFPSGSTQTVSWTETWPGGSATGSFNVTAP